MFVALVALKGPSGGIVLFIYKREKFIHGTIRTLCRPMIESEGVTKEKEKLIARVF